MTKSKNDQFLGFHTIYGVDGEHNTPYMTRIWIGRLRLHIFHRPDQDLDCHDHPWDFWTFPLTPYVEEVLEHGNGPDWGRYRQIVPAFQWSFRYAEHTHRVLGKWDGKFRFGHSVYNSGAFSKPITGEIPEPSNGKIVTLVWRSPERRKWGFWKMTRQQICWVSWKNYVFGGGRSAPCE